MGCEFWFWLLSLLLNIGLLQIERMNRNYYRHVLDEVDRGKVNGCAAKKNHVQRSGKMATSTVAVIINLPHIVSVHFVCFREFYDQLVCFAN